MKAIIIGWMLLWGAEAYSKAVSVKVRINSLKNATGLVRMALYDRDDAWLDGTQAVLTRTLPAAPKGVEFDLGDLPPGIYGIAAFHDENKNGEVDMRWLPPGPSEGIAISNEARGILGPPSFDDAKIRLEKDHVIDIKMHY